MGIFFIKDAPVELSDFFGNKNDGSSLGCLSILGKPFAIILKRFEFCITIPPAIHRAINIMNNLFIVFDLLYFYGQNKAFNFLQQKIEYYYKKKNSIKKP